MIKVPTFKFALREDLFDNKEFLPKRGEQFATGYDVKAAFNNKQSLTLKAGEYFKIPLGFRAFPEEGWWFELHPRSSSFVKKFMHNLIGIIDEHYANELIFAGQYLPDDVSEKLTINFGDAIGQIIPFERVDMIVEEVTNDKYNDLCKSRVSFRSGGFGSTDNK